MSLPHEHLPPALLNLETHMREALAEADLAGVAGELPVGAIVVLGEVIIARGHPRRIRDHNPVSHAEMQALARGGEQLWEYPAQAVLFTTLEPCPMCLGAAVIAGIRHIVFALPDAAVYSSVATQSNPYLRHHILTYQGGVLSAESQALMHRYTPAMLQKIINPATRPWYRSQAGGA